MEIEEIVCRLVENNCEFTFNKETNTIQIFSYPNREKDENSLIDFHFYGNGTLYEINLDELSVSLEELMSMVVFETKK